MTEECIAALVAERTALLEQAARNRRNGHRKQAETCERLASGCGYAVGVLRRPQADSDTSPTSGTVDA